MGAPLPCGCSDIPILRRYSDRWKMRTSLLFFALLLVANLTAYPQQSRGVIPNQEGSENGLVQPYRKKYALVVGIDEYAGGIPPLHFAVADARAVAKLLQEDLQFDSVTVLEDCQAKRDYVFQAINGLRKTDPNDQVLFYFAGHGQTFGEGNTEVGYLIPSDATGFTEEKIGGGEGLSMDDIRNRLVRVPAKHVLVLVDACYGGYAAVSTRAMPSPTRDYLRVITTSKARQLIAAGKREQVVYESTDWGHSAFTHKLIEGIQNRLADGDKNGLITATELYSYLSSSVTAITLGKQTPQFANLIQDEGEFVFILPDAAAVRSHAGDAENPGTVTLGATSKVLGSILLSTFLDGQLYVDGRFMGDLESGTSVHIKNLSLGSHEIRIETTGGTFAATVALAEPKSYPLEARSLTTTILDVTSKRLTLAHATPELVTQVGRRLSLAVIAPRGLAKEEEELLTVLVNLRRFTVIERKAVEEAKKEDNLDPDSLSDVRAGEIGMRLGADCLLFLRTEDVKGEQYLAARLLGVESKSTILSVGGSVHSTENLVGRIGTALYNELPLTEGSVKQRDGNLVTVLCEVANTLKPGMPLVVFRDGEPIIHPITKQVLANKIIRLTEAVITQVKDDSVTARLIDDGSDVKPGDRIVTK
jgi:hypothetical protein